jgi:hypothetical protein
MGAQALPAETIYTENPVSTQIDSRQSPLTCRIEGGELVIRIGVDTLAFCFEESDPNNLYDHDLGDFTRSYVVVDADEFVKDVIAELENEAEDGSTPLTGLIDNACFAAVEQGSLGVDEPGNLEPGTGVAP